jgi:hypothetical protein
MGRDPDPGSATPEALARANATGWDEGTNYSRERSLNCLYAVTGDDRLVPAMRAAAEANKDPIRYYGPPGHRVHNHGLLANLALVDTADLLHDADLRAFAMARLTTAAPGAFSPFGFTYEQSTYYHDVNVRFWTEAAALMAADPDVPQTTTALIQTRLLAARRIAGALVDPTGHKAAIGDSHAVVVARPIGQRVLSFRDDPGGIATARWSWSDPNTSWWSIRYGAAQIMHGHQDHGSVTWSTMGVPVLVDPGYMTYDPTDPMTAWQKSPAAHNVAVPVGLATQRKTGLMKLLTRAGQVDTVVVQNRSWAKPVTTTAVVDNARHRLTLTNRVDALFATHLHLAPGWTFRTRTGLTWVFVSRTRVLTITPAAAPTGVRLLRGSTSPIGGWVFPGFAQRVAAPEVVLAARGAQTLVLTVTVR